MEFTQALLQWYDEHRRTLPWRGARDAYAILVSEIMLQQTRAAAVIPYYGRFMAALPTVEALAACPEERLLKLWEGLGYYSRARNLKRCAQAVVTQQDAQAVKAAEQDISAALSVAGAELRHITAIDKMFSFYRGNGENRY